MRSHPRGHPQPEGLVLATTTTLRARLITVPARLARWARHLTPAPTRAMALSRALDPPRRPHPALRRTRQPPGLSSPAARAESNVEDPERPGDPRCPPTTS